MSEKYVHIHKIIITNHIIIRGFILYRIQIICSQTSIAAMKKHNTKIRDEMVHTMSRNLLFPWYMIVKRIVSESTMAMANIIRLEKCKLNIFKILNIK